MSRLLSPAQVIAAAVLVLSARPGIGHWLAIVVVSAGLFRRLWAIIAVGPRRVSITADVKPETRLVMAGPYRFVRHPMYAALLLFAGGFVFTPFYWWKVGVWLGLLCVLIAMANIEEHQLSAFFDEYGGYCRQTQKFIPLLW
jgi:protein-S-isoprenylcysteine O-methyltransferase Ste14